MNINVVEERAFIFDTKLTMEQAESRAWMKKLDAFGAMMKVGSLLQKPKEDDFELIYKELRYEPFWHITACANYVYERKRDYSLVINSSEVKSVTIQNVEYPVSGGKIQLNGMEHCTEVIEEDSFFEGLTSQKQFTLSSYMKYKFTEIAADDLDDFSKGDAIVLPPIATASVIVNKVITGMIKSVDAEHILENAIEVTGIELYFRPVYAFLYRWRSKEKEAVLELDGVTEQFRSGGRTSQSDVGRIIDPKFILDIGVDTLDLLLPGGGIAAKLAIRGINAYREQSKR